MSSRQSGKGVHVFKSRLSKWIAGFYWLVLAFLVVVLSSAVFFSDIPMPGRYTFAAVFSVVLLIFVFILYKAYTMNFTVTQKEVAISGIFKEHIIRLSDISSVRKVPIPFGFRLGGASFLGGYYYLPGIGNAWVCMSNFTDGVLISTKSGRRKKMHYVITPNDPQKFISTLKRKMK